MQEENPFRPPDNTRLRIGLTLSVMIAATALSATASALYGMELPQSLGIGIFTGVIAGIIMGRRKF